MHLARAALCGVMGIFAAFSLSGCGGNGGNDNSTPATNSIAVSPTTITLGQTATLTWSSNASGCTASGGWSGTQSAGGSIAVTPTTAGSVVYTLTCSGGIYSSHSDSATLTVNSASAFSQTNLVADTAGGASTVDANLVNAWGISIPPGSGFVWIANNHSETSTLYDGNGKAQPHASPLVVQFASGASFAATGVVFNGIDTNFQVTSAGHAASAKFIFDGEGGMIAGWAPSVDLTHAVTMYADAGGAIYKGLAIASNAGSAYLYAADFHNGKVDVFDASFIKQAPSSTAFTFADPSIPAGYAPFGIQALDTGTGGATQIYVTYAQQEAPDNEDEVDGAGLGYVDVYDTNGQFVKQFAAGGPLNAPWGIALAPADFGTLSNALLVGNFGDGLINGFDVATGAFIGSVHDSAGTPIASPGLWGIAFGNDVNNQPHNTLFFAAGPNDEANGVFGRIDLGATAPTLNTPPVVTLTLPATLTGTVVLSAAVEDPLSIAKVEFFAGSALIGTATTSPYTINWDTTVIADGAVSLTATATDADGNVGSSPAIAATVSNAAPPPTVTLTQLQAQIFTPICSVCHTGGGSSLPGVQNLTAGNAYTNIVNVASLEKPALLRIKPGDADNSYLVQKIEGASGISGSRMPQGCGSSSNPCLDQATIDLVKAWVNQGALNN